MVSSTTPLITTPVTKNARAWLASLSVDFKASFNFFSPRSVKPKSSANQTLIVTWPSSHRILVLAWENYDSLLMLKQQTPQSFSYFMLLVTLHERRDNIVWCDYDIFFQISKLKVPFAFVPKALSYKVSLY